MTQEIKEKVAKGADPIQTTYEVIEAKKLERKQEPAKPEPKPAPPADDFDGPDLAELVDELQAENTRLTGLIQTAEAADPVAEALKWRQAYDRSLASQSEAMDAAARSEKREKFAMQQLRRCGKAVGVDDPKKIAAAVEKLAKGAA